MAKKNITEETPQVAAVTEEMPQEEQATEEMPLENDIEQDSNNSPDEALDPQPFPIMVKVLYDPDHGYPGMLNGEQVQPGEIHKIPYGAYSQVKEHPDYKVVE